MNDIDKGRSCTSFRQQLMVEVIDIVLMSELSKMTLSQDDGTSFDLCHVPKDNFELSNTFLNLKRPCVFSTRMHKI